MKTRNILLVLILLTINSCEKTSKKEIIQKTIVKKKLITVSKENSKLISVNFKEYQINFITKRSGVKLNKETILKNDSLFISGPDVNEIDIIILKGIGENEIKINQLYASNQVLGFDGKASVIKNWKKYKSEWNKNTSAKNLIIYSEKDNVNFPDYTQKELKANRRKKPEYWYNLIINKLIDKKVETSFEPITNKLILKIEILGKENIYITLPHMIGC